MGGSGGITPTTTPTPDDLFNKIRNEEEHAHDQEFETKVAGVIADLLKEYNDRDVKTINRHLETIVKALNKDIDGIVNTCFGGSVAKHTYIDGISDVDVLVKLNDTELAKLSPEEVKEYFAAQLRARLPNTKVETGKLAVTVKFKDGDIQILPAIKTEAGFRIPDTNGTKWSKIQPEKFSSQLTKLNKSLGNKLIPTIKLAKSVIAGLPEKQRLTGYHVEGLALELFEAYNGPQNSKTMLKHFFEQSSNRVLLPLSDKTGQSRFVDEYLGNANSMERSLVADALGRISRKMKNADGSRLEEAWRQLLGG